MGDCASAPEFKWVGDVLQTVSSTPRCLTISLCGNYVCEGRMVRMNTCDDERGNQDFVMEGLGSGGTALRATMYVADNRDAAQCLTACV